MTNELTDLYNQYFDKFNRDPGGYQELDYGPEDYNDFIRDIKKSLKSGKELPEVAD